MRENVIYLVVCTAIMILAASCTDISKDDTAQKTVPEFALTYTENQAEDYPTTQGTYKLVELVYEKAGGRVGIQVSAGSVLGDERMVIERLQFGDMGFTRVSLSPFVESVLELNVLQVPYPYTGRGRMWRVLEGPIGMDFMNSFGGSNLVPLSWYSADARSFHSTDRPTRPLGGMEGFKIRAQESGLMMDAIQTLGATSVPMAFGNVYSGLQTGEIDGAKNNWLSYESTRHYEVAQYFTLDEHTRAPEFQLAAQSTWNKLPEEYGNTIRDCVRESALYGRELWAERERTPEDGVRGAGCVVTGPDIREKERFREIAAPMYEKYYSEYVGIIDDIMSVGRQ